MNTEVAVEAEAAKEIEMVTEAEAEVAENMEAVEMEGQISSVNSGHIVRVEENK
jgi:hypothetical protein